MDIGLASVFNFPFVKWATRMSSYRTSGLLAPQLQAQDLPMPRDFLQPWAEPLTLFPFRFEERGYLMLVQ